MPITRVQASAPVTAGFPSASASFASLPTAGNLVIAVATCNPNYAFAGVTGWDHTDNQSGNTWTTQFAEGQDNGCAVGYAVVVGSTGTFTITSRPQPGTTDAGVTVILFEYSGIDTTTPLDINVAVNDAVTYLTAFNVTTGAPATANSLFIAVSAPRSFGSYNSYTPPGTDNEEFEINSGDGAGRCDTRLITGGGAQNFDYTTVPNDGGPSMLIVSFREASGGGATDPVVLTDQTALYVYNQTYNEYNFIAVQNNLFAEINTMFGDVNNDLAAGYIYPPMNEWLGIEHAYQRSILDTYENWPFTLLDGVVPPNIYDLTVSGGIVFSGDVPLIRENVIPVSGGVAFSGTVIQEHIRELLVSGGVVLSGTVIQNHTNEIPVSDGVVFGGTAPITTSAIYTITPSGGIVFSGTILQNHINEIFASGGVSFAGTVTELRTKVLAPTGGVVFTGTITVEQLKNIFPSGGVVFAGTGNMIFVPAGGGGGADQIVNKITVGVGRTTRVS